MNEKIILALKNAEEVYIDLKDKGHKEHIIALHALFDSFIYVGLAVSQIEEAITELEEDMYLFEVLIEPHLKVVDDTHMVASQYTKMYVSYIAQIAQGVKSQKAVEGLFA